MTLTTMGALAGEEGEPTAKSTPPMRLGVFEDSPPGAFFFDFNDLVPGAPVACDHYGPRGLHIVTGPESCRPGVVVTSTWVPHLFCSGPCDGTSALRTDPFAGPSIKFEIPGGAMSAEVEVGDYGPSDGDNIQVCVYEDSSAEHKIGCTFASLASGHDTCCEPLRVDFGGAIFRSLSITSDSTGCMANTVYADNLNIDGMCAEVDAPLLLQHDPLWGGMPKSGIAGSMESFGAEVTTYAMLLNRAGTSVGFETNPAALEIWLAGERDGLLGPHVNPFAVARLAINEGLDLFYHGVRDVTHEDELLLKSCAEGLPAPMLLHTNGSHAGDHMVLATRKMEHEGRLSWDINDPAGRACHTGCSCYPMSFTHFFDFRPELSRDALYVALEGDAQMLVVDPAGRRSGWDEQLGVQLDEIPELAITKSALSDAQDILAGEYAPITTAERFEPMPGSYCVKPSANGAEELVAHFMLYDDLASGLHQAIPFTDDPATRPTFILQIPGGDRPVPLVQLFDNRAPVSTPYPLGERECTSPQGAAFDLVVASWDDPDCDLVDHTWTGPFPESGGMVVGESARVTLPLGASSVSLVTDDGLLDSAASHVDALVVDTVAPLGAITAPQTGTCHPGPVTLEDSFADTCDASLARSYSPGPGPTYQREGPHAVTLTVTDDGGNVSSDQVVFAIDMRDPWVNARAPQMEEGAPRTEPIARYLRSSDRDLAPGDVVHERILIDGCPIIDGDDYGDGDGLLTDELFEVTSPLLCLAHQACGQTLFADSVFSAEAADCAGNTATDTEVIAGTYSIEDLDCQ